MSEDLSQEFDHADAILADALERFQADGVSQYVYGMALLEIGLLALVKLDEDPASIRETVDGLLAKLGGQAGPTVPSPRA